MTENEAKEILLQIAYDGEYPIGSSEAFSIAIQALEEIQQYRAIGTVEELKSMKENGAFTGVELAQLAAMKMRLKEYSAIGTIEEFKALKEKSVAKKVNIEQWIDTKCSCGYVFSKHHGDGYHSIPYENKTEYCPRCGQKLDWE